MPNPEGSRAAAGRRPDQSSPANGAAGILAAAPWAPTASAFCSPNTPLSIAAGGLQSFVRSKADLIRQFVNEGMVNLASRLRKVPEKDFEQAARESVPAETASRAKEEREAFEKDIERLQEYINRQPKLVEAVTTVNIEHR